MPEAPSAPINVKQYAVQSVGTDGKERTLEVLAVGFSTHLLILVTELGKIGSLMLTGTQGSNIPGPTVGLTGNIVLLGRNEGDQGLAYEVLAGEVGESVKRANPHERRPILLGLALHRIQTDASVPFRQLASRILDGVEACRVW